MAIPKGWFLGPWNVCKEDTLEQKPRIRKGEILRHKNGSVILNCPACGATQFARVGVSGADDNPTLDGPVHCGAGHCKRCGVWFTVVGGRTKETEPRPHKRLDIPEPLKRAGVKPPPKIAP